MTPFSAAPVQTDCWALLVMTVSTGKIKTTGWKGARATTYWPVATAATTYLAASAPIGFGAIRRAISTTVGRETTR